MMPTSEMLEQGTRNNRSQSAKPDTPPAFRVGGVLNVTVGMADKLCGTPDMVRREIRKET